MPRPVLTYWGVMPDRPAESSCIVIFDGQCRLCTVTKSALERWPSGSSPPVRYLPYDSPEAKTLLGQRYRPGPPNVAWLYEPGTEIAEGLETFLRLLPRFRGGRLLVALLRFPFIHPLAARSYALIARHRYRWFGRVSTR